MTTLLVRHPPHAAEGLPARYPEVPLANPIQLQEHEFELTEITFRCLQARLLFRPGDEFNRAPGPRRPRGAAATAAVGEACLRRDICCEIGSLGPIETSNFVEMSGRSDHGGSESREPEGRKASCATRWSAPPREQSEVVHGVNVADAAARAGRQPHIPIHRSVDTWIQAPGQGTRGVR